MTLRRAARIPANECGTQFTDRCNECIRDNHDIRFWFRHGNVLRCIRPSNRSIALALRFQRPKGIHDAQKNRSRLQRPLGGRREYDTRVRAI
jgi:hypothetical protein